MTPTADDLVKNLAALSRRFAGLAAKLAQAARELEGAGTLPPDSLLEEFAAARGEFIDLRSSVLDAARTLGVTAPAPTAIDGLKALEPVVRALAEATANEPRRATLAEARRRVLVVLDRIMTINHVDDPNFAALLECQAKAREIRAAVLDPKGPTAESAAVIVEATPAFSALLTLIEGREHLDDAKFAVLEDSVTRLFGRTLTVAATRGKLVAGPADLPRAPERPAPRPKTVEEPVGPVVVAAAPSVAPRVQPPAPLLASPAAPAAASPAPSAAPHAPPPSPFYAPPAPSPAPPAPPVAPAPAAPPPPAPAAPPPPAPAAPPPPAPAAPPPPAPAAPPPPAPAAPPPPAPVAPRPRAPGASPPPAPAAPPPPAAPVKQEVAAAAPAPEEDSAPQVVETAALDEGAQWWVSAWARWTSWKGTIDFKAGVKQELGKYAYLLSVPIQQSAEYEEGLLAYGYSVLLDFVERQRPGIVTKALNSLKTFVPGKAAPSVGAHLYKFLIDEARLAEQYPEFVKSVLLAAVPEPGLWTQARILESATETSIFTHPSPRVGDPDHTTQRLTNDRQRFADHRFPVTLPPLTVRFFAVAADFREPREMDVKLKEGRAESNDAWLLTMPPVGRADLKSEVVRLVPEGSSVPALGRDCATLWVAVFNPDPKAEKKYDLTLTLKKDASR